MTAKVNGWFRAALTVLGANLWRVSPAILPEDALFLASETKKSV